MYILTSSKNQQPKRCISVFLAAIYFRCPSFSKYSRCKHESILSFDSTSLSSLLHTPIMDFPILVHDASKLIFVHMKHVSPPLTCHAASRVIFGISVLLSAQPPRRVMAEHDPRSCCKCQLIFLVLPN